MPELLKQSAGCILQRHRASVKMRRDKRGAASRGHLPQRGPAVSGIASGAEFLMADTTDSIRQFVSGKSFADKPVDDKPPGETSFDDDTLQAMSDAFDKATALMIDQRDEAIEDVAIRIITEASQGESDPEKLAATALAGYRKRGAAS
jgi:hypothetical protein